MELTDEIKDKLLQFLLESNNIKLDEVLNSIETMNNKTILEQHKYVISNLKDGRYSTYLPDDTKPSNRRKVVKPSKELLEKEIIKYYKDIEKANSLDAICLRTFYKDWLDFKSLHTDSTTYIKRIDEYWIKYYRNTDIIDVPIIKLDDMTLDIWAHSLIKTNHMTKKEYYNMSMIMRQSLQYAIQKKMIEKSPFDVVKVDRKLFRAVKKKPDETQVYLIEEQPQIEAEAYRDFGNSSQTACLAIPLAFQTGMRISELVTLKWEDINEEKENHVHIQRMEVKQFSQSSDGKWCTSTKGIVDRTKSYVGNRNVYLTTTARTILETIKQNNIENGYANSEYIFVNQNGRIHSSALNCRIRKYCRNVGISEKSMHKIRKTYISTLIDNENININYIREQVGHADERTTYGNYCFNRKSKDRTEYDMEQALVKKSS